jgi:hypothetical protein
MHIYHHDKIPHDSPDYVGMEDEYCITFVHHAALHEGGGDGIVVIHDDKSMLWLHGYL